MTNTKDKEVNHIPAKTLDICLISTTGETFKEKTLTNEYVANMDMIDYEI